MRRAEEISRVSEERAPRTQAVARGIKSKHESLRDSIPLYRRRGFTRVTKKYSIYLLFDTSKMKKTDKLPPFDLPFPANTPDVTEAFVSAYNRGALLDNILIR